MNFMGEEDRLFGLIILLSSQSDSSLHNIIPSDHKENATQKCQVDLITVKWNGIMRWNAGLIIRKFLQIAVHLQKDEHDHSQYQCKYSVEKAVVRFKCLCSRALIGIFGAAGS